MPSLSSRPTPFVANVRSHGLVHLSIPRNYLGPLTIVAENRAVLSMDVRSVVTDWDESGETSDDSTNERKGKKVATISCFLGDWEEADEASNREDESVGEDKGDNGWKYDGLEVTGHSVIVQYVDEDNETTRGFEFENGSTSAPTSNNPPSPLRSFLSAGVYRIRNSVKPELYVEMQDDGFVRPVPLNESSDGQKVRVLDLHLSLDFICIIFFDRSGKSFLVSVAMIMTYPTSKTTRFCPSKPPLRVKVFLVANIATYVPVG